MISYDLEGSGRAVVLLHSALYDRRMWQLQLEPLLAAGFQVLRPDLRGYGDTPAPTAPYNHAEDVRDLLDKLGIEQAMLVGSSLGGRVAQEVAARWPDRISTLALICAARRLHPPTADVKAYSAKEDELLAAGDLDGAADLNVATYLGPHASEQTRDLLRRIQRQAIERRVSTPQIEPANDDYDFGAITARTLVLSGAHDLDYFTESAAHLAANIPAARHTVLDWAGHLPSLEDPDRLNPLLLDFLTTN